MKPSIPVYSLDWHINKSPAKRAIFDEPLSPYIRSQEVGWDGVHLPSFVNKTPVVFFQLPPPESLTRMPGVRIIWIPMWDQACGYDLAWWQKLPKSIRVVAFSEQVKIRAQSVGLRTLHLKYCVDPERLPPVNWDNKRTLFYWNRVGAYSPKFIFKLCETLEIDIILFRPCLDPLIDTQYNFSLPPKLGNTVVRKIDGIDSLSQAEYIELLGQVNVVLAPRPLEGVGLTFIEMMARGCAVFGINAPTMNEYIQSGLNGYLFPNPRGSTLSTWRFRAYRAINRFVYNVIQKKKYVDYVVMENQNWSEIGKLDLKKLGENAHQGLLRGFQVWKNSVSQYAEFILDW